MGIYKNRGTTDQMSVWKQEKVIQSFKIAEQSRKIYY